MLRSLLSFAALLAASLAWAQPPTVLMGDGAWSYCNANFYDSGGDGGYYSDNENTTLYLCPGIPGAHVQVAFYTFSLAAGDALTIYDGPSTASPVAQTGTGSSLAGLVVQSTDPGGCLTLVFTSDASVAGTGWSGLITCDQPCEPPTAVIVPDGLLKICPGDAANLDGTYSIPAAGHFIASFQWDVGGTPYTDLFISPVFPDPGQYPVSLTVYDEIGCMSATPALMDVRVATRPDFNGTTVSDDEICLHEQVDLDPVVNGHEWTNVPTPVVGGLTILPDGSGVSYHTTVQVIGFPDGLTITSPTDIQQVCLVMEHSFLGDLTVSLSCPGGQQVVLFDGNGGGGGGTYLGSPDDTGTGVPGTGAQYCFANTAAWATLLDEDAAGNHVTAGNPPGESMTPGTYTSEGSFNGWNGCDLNGGWTVTITDHLAIDDGYIFSWWIVIDPALYPDVITYTPVYDLPNSIWSGDGVSATAADGSATATPTAEGTFPYTYTVTDDFGCTWDTTLNVTVHAPLVDFVASALPICDDAGAADLLAALQTDDGSAAPSGGTWTAPSGAAHGGQFDPLADAAGTYTYTLGDGTQCESTGTVAVTLGTHVQAGDDVALAYCTSDAAVALFDQLTGAPQAGGNWLTPSNTTFNGTLDPATAAAGVYAYVLVGTDPCPNDTAFVTVALPQAVDAGTNATVTLCADAAPFSMQAALSGSPDATGAWTNEAQATVPDSFDPASGTAGTYTYTVPATLPCPTLSATLTIALDPLPQAGEDDSQVLCANDADLPLFPLLGAGADEGGQWTAPDGTAHTGTLDPSLELNGTYTYVVTGPGTCAHLTDTAAVDVTINPVPVISFTVEPDSGCSPLLVHFTNTTDPIYIGGDCVWTLGDGSPTVSDCGGTDHLYTDAGWYHVKLRVTTPQGCTDELIKQGAVLVEPPPQATFTWTPDPATEGNSRVVFTATDPYAVQWNWTMPDGTSSNGAQTARTFEDALGGSYNVCLAVADRYGCADTLCNTVTVVVPGLYVPNAFTPNGDGDNDVFQPWTHDMAEEDLDLSIFDRWGGLVFQSSGTAKGWDGRHKNGGDVLPEGVYVWKLSARPSYAADKQDHLGFVTLLK